jgi:glycosyltransferase involved in cell wall biosynthesis
MNILYQLSTLRPKMAQAEAITQEITALREYFGGDVVYVNPNQQSPIYIPRLLFGFHKLRRIWREEANLHLHHFYNPDPFSFPYLRTLRRPVIYSVTCGVGDRRPNTAFFSALAAIAVSDERSLKQLRAWRFDNVARVQPGIDTSRFTCSPLPLQSEIWLMVGSAPWTKGQFRSKGVEALLSAARQEPHLRLVFLWRGVLADEMEHRVRQMNLEKQVTVLNEKVDVDKVLAGVHASITLAATPTIVKSYPHSLLESLAAGKPVLVSRAIPMADYVERTRCGVIVDKVTPTNILVAVQTLVARYDELRKSVQLLDPQNFSLQTMVASFQKVYQRVIDQEYVSRR